MAKEKNEDLLSFGTAEEFVEARNKIIHNNVSDFGQKLKRIRESKKMTMQEVADKLGVTQQGYAYYEKGTSTPSIKNVIRLADALGIDMGELLSDMKTNRFVSSTDNAKKVAEQLSVSNLEKAISQMLPELNSKGLEKVHDYTVDLISTNLYERK